MSNWPLKIRYKTSAPYYRHLGGEAVLMLFCTALLLVPLMLTPDSRLVGTHTQLWLPPCFFHYITSIPCPFCGMTTSFALIVRGDLVQAWLANPWGPLFYLILLVMNIIFAFSFLKKRPVVIELQLSPSCMLIIFLTIWSVKLLSWYFLR
jgi:hypothetical protein